MKIPKEIRHVFEGAKFNDNEHEAIEMYSNERVVLAKRVKTTGAIQLDGEERVVKRGNYLVIDKWGDIEYVPLDKLYSRFKVC